MPRLSHLMIKAALLWLGLGSTIGSLILINKTWIFWPQVWGFRTSHIHILLVGWLIQLVFGVAYWMLPRFDASGDRGNVPAMWTGFVAINLAVASVFFNDLLLLNAINWSPFLLIIAGIGYTIAACTFFWNAWSRALPFRIAPR